MNECTRCRQNVDAVVLMFNVRPGGHAPHESGLSSDIPETEHVCEKCLRHAEVARHPEIRRLMLFVLDGLLCDSTASGAVAVETVKAYFTVRNNEADASDDRGRAAAMRVMRTL